MTAEHHDRAFFEHMATCREPYRRLGDAIHATLVPSCIPFATGVLDIGAGLGFVAGRLRELDWAVAATDLYAPEELREPPATMWLLNRVDLKILPLAGAQEHEVVICTETAEHIPEPFADAVTASIALRAQRLIVWSAAQPGQEWPGHVNLQPPAYWLEKFSALGFDVFERATRALRFEMRLTQAQHHYAADNFFVLWRRP